MKITKFFGKILSKRGVWVCEYCGYTIQDSYDDPYKCPNCGR